MKHLIIYAHPNPQSYNHSILDVVEKTYKELGHEVIIRDLYALNYNPVLSGKDFEAIYSGSILPDTKAEQDYILWADVITFIHPIWWASYPAILKGYFDRTLTYGFAYAMSPNGIERLLQSKKVITINTHGQPKDVYENFKMYEGFNRTMDWGVFEFCGMDVLMHHYLPSVLSVTDDVRKELLAEVESKLKAILK